VTLDGERQRRLEGHLHLVRALMDRDGILINEALSRLITVVPEADHPEIADLWFAQTGVAIDILEPAELSDGGPRPWARDWDSSTG
jgi:hypothetical protein